MSVIRFIEWCGKHPFATGLFALLSVAGFIFSVYQFYQASSDANDINRNLVEIRDQRDTENSIVRANLEEIRSALQPQSEEDIDRRVVVQAQQAANGPEFVCLSDQQREVVYYSILAQLLARNVEAEGDRVERQVREAIELSGSGLQSDDFGVIESKYSTYRGELIAGKQGGFGEETDSTNERKLCYWLDQFDCTGIVKRIKESDSFGTDLFGFEGLLNSKHKTASAVSPYTDFHGIPNPPMAYISAGGVHVTHEEIPEANEKGHELYQGQIFQYYGSGTFDDDKLVPHGFGVLKLTEYFRFSGSQLMRDEHLIYTRFNRGKPVGFYIDVAAEEAGTHEGGEDYDLRESCF